MRKIAVSAVQKIVLSMILCQGILPSASPWILQGVDASSTEHDDDNAATTTITTITDNTNNNNNQREHAQPSFIDFGLVNWLQSKDIGGYFNPKQIIRREDPNDPNSMIGIFATEDIAKDDLLLLVPWKAIVTIDEDYEPIDEESEEESSVSCGTSRHLAYEMELGDRSRFAPYVSYLSQQPPGQLPCVWSDAGKTLLRTLLGTARPNTTTNGDGDVVVVVDHDHDYDDETPRIPPDLLMSALEGDWYGYCNADPEDEFGTHVAMLVVQRADDDIMVPVYDLYNHRNGHYFNTEGYLEDGVRYEMRASRPILRGEQIHNSYNLCHVCENRFWRYGTPQIFRDYGFVERMPQRWPLLQEVAPHRPFEFDLVEETVAVKNDDHDEKTTTTTTTIVLKWRPGRSPHHQKVSQSKRDELVDYFQTEIQRLNHLRQSKFTERDPSIPAREWNLVWEYEEAVIRAFTLAHNDLVDKKQEDETQKEEL